MRVQEGKKELDGKEVLLLSILRLEIHLNINSGEKQFLKEIIIHVFGVGEEVVMEKQ